MLKDSFFSITDVVDSEYDRTCCIALNHLHPIFQAHFAGHPIMPGACVVQLIKELTADYLDRSFFVSKVKNMKFLHVINPLESPEITVKMTFTRLENDCISVATTIYRNDKAFSKSTLILIEQ